MTAPADNGAGERALAETVVGFRYADLSPAALTLAKIGLSDTIGVGIAGSRDEVSVIIRELIPPVSGPDSASIWGTSFRASVPDAAYANAVASHALDWDDYMHPLFGHCSSILLPVALAISETREVTGQQFVEAYLAGYEVEAQLARITRLKHYELGWHSSSTIGVFGAAATAAKLLGLTGAETNAALGIAASHSSGIRENFGTMTKALHAGNAARQGIYAAQLAARGITASATWLLGGFGYLSTYGGELDAAAAAELLQAPRANSSAVEGDWGLVLKPYASCGSSHAAVDAVIDLVERHRFSADQIEQIDVHVDPAVTAMLPHHDPQTSLEGRYSMEFTIAVAAVDRAGGADQFATASIGRADVRSLMSRVVVASDLNTGDDDKFAAEVGVRVDGKRFSTRVDYAQGHPANPMDAEARWSKFDRSVRPILHERTQDLYAALNRIETIGRSTEIAELVRA